MPESGEERTQPWLLRHVTKLLLGVGVLLFVDSRTTGLLVAELDEPYDRAKLDDTPDAWRAYVAGGGRSAKAQAELARLHEAVRANLREAAAPRPDGLDPLLAVLQASVDNRVYLETEPLTVDRESFAVVPEVDLAGARVIPIGEKLVASDWTCASGMSKAFAGVTGGDTIVVETMDAYDADPSGAAPRIHLRWSARASGMLYGRPTDTHLFPGFTITAALRMSSGDVTLLELESTVDPGATFEFTSYGLVLGIDPGDVVSGMVESACRSLAEQVIGELTGWAPAVGSGPGEQVTATEKCERSDAQGCLVAGEALRDSDPAGAIELFEKGCRSPGLYTGDACVAAAELMLAHPGDEPSPRLHAMFMFGQGCRAHHPLACARAAELRLMPYENGTPASDESRREAHVLRLRACDLGHAESCAARDVRLVSEERTFFGVALAKGEKVFDVRWGMWFQSTEQEVLWIASPQPRATVEGRLSTEIAMHRARVYDAATLPPDPRHPADATTVFAIVDEPKPVLGESQPCPPCTAESLDNPFWSVFCECLPTR